MSARAVREAGVGGRPEGRCPSWTLDPDHGLCFELGRPH